MRRAVRVLYLDGFRGVLRDLSDIGIELRVTPESKWNPDSYEAPASILDATRRLTSWNEVDFVIIGNNLGAGVKKAEAVAPAMRPHTVIVWNERRPGDEAAYAALGYTRFMTRLELRDQLAGMLGAN